MLQQTKSAYTVAIAGQPNTGKSTLFNSLAGLQQAVSNFPGKTVEKKMEKPDLRFIVPPLNRLN